MRGFVVVVLLCSGAASAQSHRGSLGLTVASGGEFSTSVSGTTEGRFENGVRVPVELGGTLGITDKSELTLSARVAPGVYEAPLLALSFYSGLRQSFGYDKWKTFVDLQLAIHALPAFTAGARVAFGVQYDFADIAGVYAQLGAQLGGGFVLRLGAEVLVGLQFRTYLFE
ncbi:MAG: hypothetical protein DI536_05640 [Archangium gephyra]|uniref:Outer membrane protein beta-barrel domain-containing protein n=1 Tax=Archangium gephyra TaxID=48 RepID=A0A2W5TM22_9BACT|nr:MAG: hypothetical protein DI536_05640 [Archangium gephyra]